MFTAEIPVLYKSLNRPRTGLSEVEKQVLLEAGDAARKMMKSFAELDHPRTQIVSTTTLFNLRKLKKNFFNTIINLKRVNDIRRVNKFLEEVNERLPQEGLFIGCVETHDLRKKRLINKFPGFINRLYLALDYVFKRVIPKLPFTKQLYFALTNGHNRVISRAEMLGRLYSCGFEVVHEETIGYLFYFVARKIKAPAFDAHASYGPIFKMARTGKDGKTIYVYKFRTMYPYSEYLQPYIYERNKLDKGGKFRDDFRVTGMGKFMRKFWIDELPMIINMLRRDLKPIGVRPLSKHYQSLYPQEVIALRNSCRPGLLPPYYADLPETLEEIVDSERRYLESYQKNPFWTDLKYFIMIFTNIVFKQARSK